MTDIKDPGRNVRIEKYYYLIITLYKSFQSGLKALINFNLSFLENFFSVFSLLMAFCSSS